MAGHLFISPGEFKNAEDLPTVEVTPVAPIPGATVDFAADRVTPGALLNWYDMISSESLTAPNVQSQHPVATGAGTGKYIRFDGVNDRMDVNIDLTQPITLAVVARIPTPGAGKYILTGGQGPAFNLGMDSAASRWIFYAGATLPAPLVTPDNGWHIFVITVNGPNSVFSLDGVEAAGNSGALAGTSIRVGASSGAYFGTDIKRLAVLPYAAGAVERAALYHKLALHYGL